MIKIQNVTEPIGNLFPSYCR